MRLAKDRRDNNGADAQSSTGGRGKKNTGAAKQAKPAAKPEPDAKKKNSPASQKRKPRTSAGGMDIDDTKQTGNAPQKRKAPQKPEKQRVPLIYLLRCFIFTFIDAVYRRCYYVGIQLLRSTRTSRRHMRRRAASLREAVRTRKQRQKRNLHTALWELKRGLTSPFYDVREHFNKLRREREIARQRGQKGHVARLYAHMAWYFCKKSWRVVRAILNYLIPVGAAVLLFFTVNNAFNQSYGLRVIYGGQQLGYIADESVYNQATAEVQARISGETDIGSIDFTPQLELVRVPRSRMLSVDQLSNLLIRSSVSDLVEADGFYLESTQSGRSQMQLVGVLEDGTELLDYLNATLESYRTSDMDEYASIQFVKKLQLKSGLYPANALRSTAEIRAELEGEERGEKRYTVISGDTPLRIAQKNGITFEELKSLNPDVDVSLFPGDSLLISQSVPRMSVQVTTTMRYEETIPYNIKQETNPEYDIGWTRVIQEGHEGTREITAQVVMINGEEISRELISTRTIESAVDRILEVGGNRPLQVIPSTSASSSIPSGAFGWPTVAGNIGTGFLGYYGHTGADIVWSGCYGAPVLASADGVVVASGRGGAYGYRVIIDHGGGVQTLYAHCSSLVATVGEQVSRGQTIGLIGRTGNATGPHVHFEIRINGTPQDPAPYLYN